MCGGFSRTTNNRMEIFAVLEALSALRISCIVELYTDSQYVAKAIKDCWLENWQRNHWLTAAKKPVKNQDLWQQMPAMLSRHEVHFHWLKGHAGHKENERCDELARGMAMQKDLPEDTGFME
jgi:ribonuclease HI